MTLSNWLRQHRHRVQVGFNRALGRVFLPDPRQFLYVETSSLCNLACAFCAYPKKTSPKVTMSNDFFFDVIEQATRMGYERFGLTPITGDLFMDKQIMEKMAFLERHPKVKRFHFYTNFVLPEDDMIRRLAGFTKLSELGISLYGHDQQSFIAITKGNQSGYRRLLKNLQSVYDVADSFQARVEIHWRIENGVQVSDTLGSELATIVRRLEADKGLPVSFTRQYNNWGGLVTQDDVSGLNIEIAREEDVPKNGACHLIFHKQQVMADGRVNACACRDANATLTIGDLRRTALRDILSSENLVYMTLIENQEAGRFNEVCGSCDFYRSIYKSRRLPKGKRLTMREFRHAISRGPDDATGGVEQAQP